MAVGDVPCQRDSQIHCALMVWTSVSRTEPKLAMPGSVSCAALS